jgi:hypothetical protein
VAPDINLDSHSITSAATTKRTTGLATTDARREKTKTLLFNTSQRKALQHNKMKETKNYEPLNDTFIRRLSFSAPAKTPLHASPNHKFNTSLGTVGRINRRIYQTTWIISLP